MNNVVEFPRREIFAGNGSRSILKEFFEVIYPDRSRARPEFVRATQDGIMPDEDYFLAWLYNEGYKIIPVADDEVADLKRRVVAHEQLQARIAAAIGLETWEGDLAQAITRARLLSSPPHTS